MMKAISCISCNGRSGPSLDFFVPTDFLFRFALQEMLKFLSFPLDVENPFSSVAV